MDRIALFAFTSLLLVVTSSLGSGTIEVYASNRDAGGTDLRWTKYVPITGGPTFPAALVVHGGRWKAGSRGPLNIAQDLATSGYLALAIEYRLAPPHTEMTGAGPPGDAQQDPPSDGRPTQQTDDIQQAIRAARADPLCNGKVVVLGFSAGGDRGAWQVIAGTLNDDKPDAFVGCSGVYDLDDSNLLSLSVVNRAAVENYIDHTTDEGATFHTAARAASPYWLTPSSTPAPSLLFYSSAETIPQTVGDNMVTKLTGASGTIESHLLTGNLHGSEYWYSSYGGAFSTVKECAIDFLNRMLAVTPPTPVAPAKIVLKLK